MGQSGIVYFTSDDGKVWSIDPDLTRGVHDLDGFPDPSRCGETFAAGGRAVYRREFGEPEFPDALHVVVSIMGGKINDIKCFKWDGGTGTFYVLEDCV